MIPFNQPAVIGTEEKYIAEALKSRSLCGNGCFHKKCHQWFESQLQCNKVFLTTSCTHSLEMAAILIDIQVGDEVIMPSYTFVSTANAFVLRGAKIIFVDIRPDTMNIDEKLIERAITKNTKAIVPVHYGGIACEMDAIMDIAKQHSLYVIEDAAHGMMANYKGRALGTIGHLGAFSFHETKNYTSGGEGGLLIINDEQFIERAEVIREKGTNRAQFFRGAVDKYSWVDLGSSYLLSELNAAYLLGQLEHAEEINNDRLSSWNKYYKLLVELQNKGFIEIPVIPEGCTHNAHMFYIKVADLKARTNLIENLNDNGIGAVFHYVPLHSAPAGLIFSMFNGEDNFTTKESERVIRLPMYYGMKDKELLQVVKTINEYC
ncbi:MAG: dTDP-4-amino-4,6-dideoxygalactose transaminase [Candidatus Endonucleobacter sp. (ex Gigantidas childressi)]|nr:dTDP-4-amino-4,6-dideoxygalactose transaminase [Candidatus Endonucleobacter sp. (ex Gigantidas childressi)]